MKYAPNTCPNTVSIKIDGFDCIVLKAETPDKGVQCREWFLISDEGKILEKGKAHGLEIEGERVIIKAIGRARRSALHHTKSKH
jgi:hypothetical protein